MGVEAALLFAAVVGARFGVPLLIPRFPLPAIVAALVLDAIDQTVFQTFGYDPPGYQGYDKAMDVYYLSIAYLSTMRNWTSAPAVEVARFLFFYRQIGVVAFELTGWRALLLVFPNTFEYFFIAYEVFRLVWNPARFGARFWVVVAAVIWLGIKLPQEYWIHIAQLDLTDVMARLPWLTLAVTVVIVVLASAAWSRIRPRLPARERTPSLLAEPLPEEMDTAAERAQWRATHGRLMSRDTAEMVLLVGLLCVIYGNVLPGQRLSALDLFLGIGAFAVANLAISVRVARQKRSTESVFVAFVARVLLNVGLVVLSEWLLADDGEDLPLNHALFFVLLLSLITMLDDRYRPVYKIRFSVAAPATPSVGASSGGGRAGGGRRDRAAEPPDRAQQD